MKTKTYAAVRREMAGQAQAEGMSACLVCGAETPRDTLGLLGARCRPCFAAYCREPRPPVRQARAKAKDVLSQPSPVDPWNWDDRREAMARRVAEYAQAKGIAL